MRIALAAVALLAILPSAHAQDRAKGDFSHSGEFRLRDNWDMNQTGNAETQPTSDNNVIQRFKLDLGFRASEKLAAELTLIHGMNWGRPVSSDGVNINRSTLNTPDGSGLDYLFVNQAYATWMVSEDIKLKFGRQNYQIADGTLISINDWQANPTAFEGVLGNYEAEFGKVQAFAFKFRELNATQTQTTSDAERNVYGLNFDLKTMPELVKALNVHVLKDIGDATQDVAPNEGEIGRSETRYGLYGSFNLYVFDFKVWYEAVTGKQSDWNGTLNNYDVSSNMIQAEVAAHLPSFMGARVFARYHRDSGDSDVSPNNGDELYDPYFYTRHGTAGQMDIFSWGNLTFIELGTTFKPMDSTEVGVSYWMLSRTESGNNSTGVVNRQQLGRFVDADLMKTHLGDEIDVWAEHNYGGGLSTVARFGYFMPGDVFTSSANSPLMGEKPMQIFIEGRLTF